MSKAMKLLQQKCGCKADGSFGPNTARGIVSHYQLTPEEGAHLLGQASHESGNFKYVRENLNSQSRRSWPHGRAVFLMRKAQSLTQETRKRWLRMFTLTALGMTQRSELGCISGADLYSSPGTQITGALHLI
jgi:predicted chitinase